MVDLVRYHPLPGGNMIRLPAFRSVLFRLAPSLAVFSLFTAPMTAGKAQTPGYVPPAMSASLLKTIPWARATQTGKRFQDNFEKCDAGPCASDKNRNTALLRFPDGTIFFEAKMGLDTDGATFQGNQGDPTHLPNTSWQPELPISGRSPVKEKRSIDSDAIRYIVLPIGDFRRETGLQLGDVAMVVYDGAMFPAVVADTGPYNSTYKGKTYFRIGEGSIALHEALGHPVRKQNPDGTLRGVFDRSIPGEVLYFVFPGSKPDGLTWENLLEKIDVAAKERFAKLTAAGYPE